MCEQLLLLNFDINDTAVPETSVSLEGEKDDLTFFFPSKPSSDSSELNTDQQTSKIQTDYIKQIQTHLALLTKPVQWSDYNTKISEFLTEQVFPALAEQNQKLLDQITARSDYKQQLQISLDKRLQSESFIGLSIFGQPFGSENDSTLQEQKAKYQSEQLSYFAIQSLVSILLILIRSSEKNDPLIVQQILTLTSQLCEQLPVQCLSSTNTLLFKSLLPLTDYIQDLSRSTDLAISKDAIRILLSFSLAKGSFKEILSLLSRLIFNTTDTYNVQGLFIQLNQTLKEWEKQTPADDTSEFLSLNYIKSTSSSPQPSLTGQMITSLILSHLDVYNEVYKPNEQGQLTSMSCEFHLETFRILFTIIEQLTSSPSTEILRHMLGICLRLFTTHLQFLCDLKSNVPDYLNSEQLQTWFDLFFQLSCDETQVPLAREASKALVKIIDIRTANFPEKLSIIHQYILENKHSILIKQCFLELTNKETLVHWIDSSSSTVLYSFVDLYFDDQHKDSIEAILLSWQQILLSRLITLCDKKMLTNDELSFPSLLADYFAYIFQKHGKALSVTDNLFQSILLHLCAMTTTEKIFLYEAIQPIFIPVIPLLANYYLDNLENDYSRFFSYLLGRMTHVLVISLPQDALEVKHSTKLNALIFTGGCVTNECHSLLKSNLATYSHLEFQGNTSDDRDLLTSIYNNVDQGAELLLKLKSTIKDKQPVLQKSIEQAAHEACAAMFAVYVKYYRRMNLAKAELQRTDQHPPHNQLISIYRYANHVQSFFATIKAQGGDCEEFSRQIRIKTLFLLNVVRENDCIPIIEEEDPPSSPIDVRPKTPVRFQRQQSRWSKAKHVLKLLRHLFQACIRLKKLMLEKKQANELKYDYESLLRRTIEHFVYGDLYKTSNSTTNEEKQVELFELENCLTRQHERALTRLITYRFIQTFLDKLVKKDEHATILACYLPYLRSEEIEWSYFDEIQATNNQLREQISSTYYSIIHLIFSSSPTLMKTLFYLLNLSYTSIDLRYLHHQQFVSTFFLTFIRCVPEQSTLEMKLIAFNWFRLFLLKLCENIQQEKVRGTSNQLLQQQQQHVFHTLIFKELKDLMSIKDTLPISSNSPKSDSLKDLTLGWFIHAKEAKTLSITDQLEVELCLNQYLVLLFRCIYFYSHVSTVCATVDYLQQFLSIYHQSQSNVTRVLAIKLLRSLIPQISETADGTIKDFFEETLHAVGDRNTPLAIVAELINMYRRIMSPDSRWQSMAIELVCQSITSQLNLSTIETNDTTELNKLRASLNILGGYIEPYRIGSIVKVDDAKDPNEESQEALIIEIEETSFKVQYLQTNQVESVSIDRLRFEKDVPVSILSSETIVDALGSFIEIDTSTSDSVMLLQLQRRAVAVLYRLLNEKQTIETFMNKPYASTLAKLCLSETLESSRRQPSDLLAFTKQHLQHYDLSLDACERSNQIVADTEQIVEESLVPIDESDCSTWTNSDLKSDPIIVESLAISTLKYNGWKPYASAEEIECFKQGRIGNDDIRIVPMPPEVVEQGAIQESGTKHRYHGRMAPNYENAKVSFPSFVFENLQLSEGNWYYCVKLPVGGVIQIGWATKGFSPAGSTGVGDDSFSWSYDGSRAVTFWDQGFYGQFDDIRWKEGDVCGCGIEINGKNTNIKYWLNGKLLGTAFAHDTNVPTTSTKCNLLPNGPNTTFYPVVTIQWTSDPIKYCDWIVSPEDMEKCPLPEGYKPLLVPKLVRLENTIVDYPFHAYLVGDDLQNTIRTKASNTLLRDFIHGKHLPTTLTIADQHLVLPDSASVFPLSLKNDEMTSLSIAFDFQITSSDSKIDIPLFEIGSVPFSWPKLDETEMRCIIICLAKKRQIKVYLNKQCRIFSDAFSYEAIRQFTIHILPSVPGRLANLGVWKYALSQDQIHRLMTYGLSYIAHDYEQQRHDRQRINTISFAKDQQTFTDELLLPFDEPFTVSAWEKKQQQIDEKESSYLKSHDHDDHSTVELFGNKSYLVLEKSKEEWSTYTLVLVLSIPQWPVINEKLTLLALNSSSELSITHEGKLRLVSDATSQESQSTLVPNQSFRLFLSLREESFEIYVNDTREIEVKMTDDRFQIKANRLDLFKEVDRTKNNTPEDKLRISFQSITYLDRPISIHDLESLNIHSPSFQTMGSTLIAMGYKRSWLKSVIEQNPTADMSTIREILFKQKEHLIQKDLEVERKRYVTIFSKLDPSIEPKILENLIGSSTLEISEQITNIVLQLFTQWTSSSSIEDQTESSPVTLDTQWFPQSVNHLGIPENITFWIQEKSSSTEEKNPIEHLFDFNQSKKKTDTPKLTSYSHQGMSSKQYLQSRIACEHGLTTIYACSTVLKMFQVWSHDQTHLFPLTKLGDYPFLVNLLKLLDGMEKTSGQIHLLIRSILKIEIEQVNTEGALNDTSLLYHLQRDIMTQSIQFLFKPSLFPKDLTYILKILHLFLDIITDLSSPNKQPVHSLLFPVAMINLLFDLFLLAPTHPSKIAILQLFTRLLQTSETCQVNHSIQQFFYQLLVELFSNTINISSQSQKSFQIALADFIFALSNKPHTIPKRLPSTKFPEQMQTLFTAIETIIAWTDPSKSKVLPEKFLEQCPSLLGETVKLTEDEFQRSNKLFNTIADQDLIQLMNNDSTMTLSFSDFIQSLPSESEPNATHYKNYLSLSAIPADSIRLRAQFIYLFNKFIEKSLSMVDFSLPVGRSIFTDHIRTIKCYLLSITKFQLFQESLDKTETSYSSDYESVHFDTVKASTDLENSESTMFEQAYQQLHANAHVIFRRPNDQLWQAQYVGMHSTDAGGPYRDSITRICADINSNRLPLFILCPNGRTNCGLNRDCWLPNVFPPEKPIRKKLVKQYRFVGQLLAMAVRKKHYLDLKFAPLLWKRLLREEITAEDIEAIDIQGFTMLNDMEKNVKQIKSIGPENDIDCLFSSIMSEIRFDAVSSSGQIYELIPGGKTIPITFDNFKHYCSAYREYRLNEFNRQIDLIAEGFYSVIPGYYLSLFTSKELEEAACGKGQIDIEILKRNTNYGGEYSQESPVIAHFWTVMSEMFTDEQKKSLLVFAWGRSTLPSRDEDFSCKLTINTFDVYGGDVDQTLPRSHTCYFAIDLPAYSTVDVMYERLNYAISYCSSIDGDGMMVEPADRENDNPDED